jgi:hypothetical protein
MHEIMMKKIEHSKKILELEKIGNKLNCMTKDQDKKN